MKLKLITFSNNICTVGNLYDGDDLICHTMELPWLKNNVNVSCIHGGVYQIKPVISEKFGNTYKITNVIGRTHILFHKGNTTHDTEGCILPCDTFGILDVKGKSMYAGLSSKKAYTKLMHVLGGGTHTLTIKRY